VQRFNSRVYTEIVHMLLDLPLNRGVATRNNEALQLASDGEHTEIVRMICRWIEVCGS
jgi:hypothetical protein